MTEIWNLSTLCRCCHRDGSFKSLNMPYEGENGDEMYEALLKETLGINIIQPPEHLEASHTICDNCITRLRDANQFRQQVMACEEKFKIYCTNEDFINEAAINDDNSKPLVEFNCDGFDEISDNHQDKAFINEAVIDVDNVKPLVNGFNYDGFDNTSDIHKGDNLLEDEKPITVAIQKDYKIEVNIEPVSDIKSTKVRKSKSKINKISEKRVSKKEIPRASKKEIPRASKKEIPRASKKEMHSSKRNIKRAQDDLMKYTSNYDDDALKKRRDKIIYLFKQGHSKRIITKVLNMSRNTVKLWIKRHIKGDDLTDNRRFNHGTLRVTPEQRNSMWQYYEERGLTNTRQFATEFNVTMETIRNHLNSMGLHYKNTKKVILTDRQKSDRLNFAHYYLNFDWSNVIFSDEKSFYLDENGNLNLCSEENVASNKKSKNICVNLWGWMSLASVGELAEIPLRVKSRDYVCVLDEIMLPTVRIIYPQNEVPNFYYLQDNCPIHTSKIVVNWFKEHQNEVNVIHWPANSPDLNPIGDLFGLLCQMWENKMGKSKDGFKEHCHQIWEVLRASNICSGLVGSMHTRLQDVIANGGGYTRF